MFDDIGSFLSGLTSSFGRSNAGGGYGLNPQVKPGASSEGFGLNPSAPPPGKTFGSITPPNTPAKLSKPPTDVGSGSSVEAQYNQMMRGLMKTHNSSFIPKLPGMVTDLPTPTVDYGAQYQNIFKG